MKTKIALFSLVMAGCAAGPKGLGFGDARLSAAMRAANTRKVEMVVNEDGSISKISVQHANADGTPDGIRKISAEKFPGSTVVEYEQESYADAGAVDEVEVKTADGKECEVSATVAGAFRYTECKLAPADLPAPVAKTMSTELPDATIGEAEERKGPVGDEFRIEAKSADGRGWYVRIKTDGTLISRSALVAAEMILAPK